MPTVNHPRLGEINFPDTMTRDEIVAALRKIDAGEVGAPAAAAPQPVSPREFTPTINPVMLAGRSIADLPSYGGTLDERLSGMARGAAEAVPTIVRLAPAAAAVAFPPAGVAGYAAMGGATALTSALADVMERGQADRGTLGEAAKGFITGAAPLPQGAARGWTQVAGNVGKAVASGFGSTIGGDIAAKRIATGEFPNAEEALGMAREASVVGAMVGGLSGVGSYYKGMADINRDRMARQALYEGLGDRGITLAKIEPAFENTERVISNIPAYAQVAERRAATVSNITKAWYDRLGDPATPQQIKERMAPFMRIADETDSAVRAAQDRFIAAEARLAQAQENVNLLPGQLSQIREESAKEMLAAIGERAKAEFQAANMLGAAVTDTDAANALSITLQGMHKAVSQQADELYKKLSFPSNQKFIPRDDLFKVAKSILGDDANLPEGKAILSRIRSGGAEPEAGAGVVLLNAAGKPIKAPEAKALMSLDEFRSLRKELSGLFGPQMTPGQIENGERLASKAYKAIGETVGDLIAVNPADKEAYDTAQTFWREISEARHSNLGRALFDAPIRTTEEGATAISGVRASAISSIANGIANGDIDQLKAFKRFSDVLGRYDKNIAALGETTMIKAVRNHFLAKNKDNAIGLLDDLVKAGNRDDVRPYIDALGFGTVDEIRQWRAAVRSIDGTRVSTEVLTEALDNPRVREAIANQAGLKQVATKAIAEKIVEQKLLQAQTEKALGATERQRKALADAEKLAKKAGVDLDVARMAANEAANHPIAKVFAGGYTITDEIANGTTKGTLTHALMRMDGDTGKRFMRSLESRDPAFANLVRRRIIADEMEQFARVERRAPGATTAFDPDAVSRYFNPVTPADKERMSKLRDIVGSDAFNGLNKWAKDFSAIGDDMRAARLSRRDTGEDVSMMAGFTQGALVGGPGSNIGSGFFAKQLFNITRRPYYRLHSWLLVDKDAARHLEKTGDLLGYLKTIPVQKAAQIMADRELAPEISRYHQERKNAQSLGR